MRIDRQLNLVIPIDRDDGSVLYVHSMPISREVFEQYHLVLARTWSRILKDGIDIAAGPAVAAMTLKQFAMEAGVWDDPPQGGQPGVRNGLMAEVERLSNVLVGKSDGGGWEVMPLNDAKRTDLLSDGDVSRFENAVVFFTCALRLLRKAAQPAVLGGMNSLWGAQTTLYNCTDFMHSLPTSTRVENTGAITAEGLLVPS